MIDLYRRQKDDLNRDYDRAQLLRERYPRVARVEILREFVDFDDEKVTQGKTLVFAPESRAFFQDACPHVECIGTPPRNNSGFDFGAAVRDAMEQGLEVAEGTLTCQGWQDQARMHKYGCRLKCNYRIRIVYVQAPPGPLDDAIRKAQASGGGVEGLLKKEP